MRRDACTAVPAALAHLLRCTDAERLVVSKEGVGPLPSVDTAWNMQPRLRSSTSVTGMAMKDGTTMYQTDMGHAPGDSLEETVLCEGTPRRRWVVLGFMFFMLCPRMFPAHMHFSRCGSVRIPPQDARDVTESTALVHPDLAPPHVLRQQRWPLSLLGEPERCHRRDKCQTKRQQVSRHNRNSLR